MFLKLRCVHTDKGEWGLRQFGHFAYKEKVKFWRFWRFCAILAILCRRLLCSLRSQRHPSFEISSGMLHRRVNLLKGWPSFFVWTRCCTLFFICHTTPTQNPFSLHDFRQAEPPQRIDWLGSMVRNSCLSQEHSDALPHRESNQGFATFRLLARRLYELSYAATCWYLEKVGIHSFPAYFSIKEISGKQAQIPLVVYSLGKIFFTFEWLEK